PGLVAAQQVTRPSLGITSAALALVLYFPASFVSAAPAHADLTGSWVLNRAQSQFKNVGFDPIATPETADSVNGAGRSRSRGGGRGAAPAPFALSESEEDYAKRRLAIGEVEQPSESLTIAQTDATVSITDDHGHARMFHTNGKEEGQPLGD